MGDVYGNVNVNYSYSTYTCAFSGEQLQCERWKVLQTGTGRAEGNVQIFRGTVQEAWTGSFVS